MSYSEAKKKYAKIGVDTEKVLKDLSKIAISLHCWQGDDVTGFETTGGASGGTGGKCGWYGVTTPCYSSDPGNASLDSALASIIIGDAATIAATIAEFLKAAKIAAGLTVGGVTVTTILAIVDLVGGYDRARLKGRLWFVGGGGGGGGGSGAGANLAIGAGGAGGGGGGGGGSGFFLIGAGSIYPNHADKPDVESPLPLSGHGGGGGASSVEGASGVDASEENNGEAKHTARGDGSGGSYNCADGTIGTWSWRRDGDNWAWSGKGAAGGVARDILINEVPLIFRRDIYAMACLAGGLFYTLGELLSFPVVVSQLGCAAVVITIRMLAVRYHWQLPIVRE